MPAYVVLGNFTDQGIRNIKNLRQLRDAAGGWTASKGGRVIANYTTFGQYHFVHVAELPSDEIALEAALTFGSQGEVRTQILKAFEEDAVIAIAERLP